MSLLQLAGCLFAFVLVFACALAALSWSEQKRMDRKRNWPMGTIKESDFPFTWESRREAEKHIRQIFTD